ncbi:MAG: radical SAM protein [Anaerolineae bacterium]|nr:radical SAM protein [Anaerolineae bacterium]
MELLKRNMYRFPWSGNDNPIGWLEVTDKCNTYCRGCYRINGMQGHKSVEQIKEEINLLKKWRNCDNISIAGGEPLIHPNIIEIVAHIRGLKMKPLILTNAIKLYENRPMVVELKKAGAVGFTFHIDSEQQRPHWKGKTEEELFELRQYYADMVHDVGGLFASFGMTVYPGNLHMVPDMVRWANKNIDRVHGLVLIGFRNAVMEGDFDYYANGQKVDLRTSYVADNDAESYLTSADIYAEIKKHFPHYETSAYMGGSQVHDKLTWLVSAQLGAKGTMYGSAGKKVMELFQVFHHLQHGTYVIYSPSNKIPKIAFALGLFDKGVRQAHGQFWKEVLRNPMRLFQPMYVQSIGIIQGPDLLEDGRVDMCESCPDMTVWDGKLVHSCRMDEWRLYGSYVQPQPRQVAEGELIEPAAIPVNGREPSPN